MSFILVVTFFDLQSDYEQYCTGLTGFFVEIFDGGQCNDLENYMFITSIGTLIFGLLGIIFLILGVTTPSSSGHRLMMPQQYVQRPQQYVQHPQQYVQHPQQYVQHPQQYVQHPQQNVQHPHYLNQYSEANDKH